MSTLITQTPGITTKVSLSRKLKQTKVLALALMKIRNEPFLCIGTNV